MPRPARVAARKQPRPELSGAGAARVARATPRLRLDAAPFVPPLGPGRHGGADHDDRADAAGRRRRLLLQTRP